MKRTPFLIFMIVALSLLCSCTKKAATVTDGTTSQYPISLTSVKMSDTASFKRSNGKVCMEFVDVSVTYPKFFIDKASTAKLQKLFTRMVLEGNDSLDIDDALKEYTRATLNSNSLDSTDVNEYAVAEGAVSDRILIAVNITIAYHQHDILTLCKEETVKKDEVSSKTHQYYNIDLKNIAPIDLSMFRSDAFGAVCKALKQQLMTQNRAKNSDELNDLGFFNIDNLTLTTNFCFGENGVTWSSLPQELAADANLEPKITLDYATLKRWASDKSVLKRF